MSCDDKRETEAGPDIRAEAEEPKRHKPTLVEVTLEEAYDLSEAVEGLQEWLKSAEGKGANRTDSVLFVIIARDADDYYQATTIYQARE